MAPSSRVGAAGRPKAGDAPRIAGPGPFGIPVRLCTAIPEGPDRLQWRPVFATSQTCGSQAQGPSGVLVRRLCTATPPQLAGPGPLGIPAYGLALRVCRDRAAFNSGRSTTCRTIDPLAIGPRTALTRRGSIQQKRDSRPPRTEAPDGSPTDTLRASRPSASVMGRSQWPVCRGVDCGRGITG